MFVDIVHSSKYEKKSKKLRLNLMLSSLALATLIPVNFAFAEEVATSDETSEKAKKTNESTLNWLESEDYIFAAERIPTNRWDTPANVHVITAEEIERNHYHTVEEALKHVNGIVITTYSSNSSDVLMNGDYRVLLLIDGRRANNSQEYQYASNKSDMTMIPSMKMIERIEIVKGGYSALYGTDALGGVVNIITKKGTRSETTVDVSFGSNSRQNYQFTHQDVYGKFAWFLSGGLSRSNPYNYKGNIDVLSEHSDYNNNNFFVRMDNRFTDRDSLNLSLTHKGRHSYEDMDKGNYTNVSLSYNFKEGTSTPGWFRYFDNHKSALMTNGSVTVFQAKERMKGLEYQNGWEFGRHKIIVGAEWHKNIASNELRGYSDKDMINKAVYLQDTMRLGDKWIAVIGTRWDHSNKFGSNWSPKISANYRPDEKTKFYASWGRVYRTPSISDLYMVDDKRNKYGNQFLIDQDFYDYKLRSEKGHTETIGAEHNFDENTAIAVNLFQSKVTDVIYWDKEPIPYFDDYDQFLGYIDFNFPSNQFSEKRRGVEISFKQNVNDHFSYNLAYSRTKIDNDRVMNYFAQPNGYRIGLHYKNRGLRINLLGVMASGLDDDVNSPDSYISNRYAIFDLNVSYDMNENSTIYLKFNNFTNQEYSNANKQWHSPGRSFVGGATFRF